MVTISAPTNFPSDDPNFSLTCDYFVCRGFLLKGNVIEGGPQICVVNLRLASLWVFAQVPYQSGPVAASVNGVWDDAWRTWALVAEMQLGEDCEIVPAVEMILKVVHKTSVSGHHQWSDQARCDYPGVAMRLFARDYRAYRELFGGETVAASDFPEHGLFDLLQDAPRVRRHHDRTARKDAVLGAHDRRPDAQAAAAGARRGGLGRRRRHGRRRGDTEEGEEEEAEAGRQGEGAAGAAEVAEAGAEADAACGRCRRRRRERRRAPPRRFEGGSAFPDNKFMARNDTDDSLLGIIQAKMDQSNGIDKGACVWCLLGSDCPHDRRVGLQAPCGRAHMGPADRKPQLCIAACTTAGLNGPLYLNSKKFWTVSLSGHSPAEAKPKEKLAGGTKGTPVPSEDDDDNDDDP